MKRRRRKRRKNSKERSIKYILKCRGGIGEQEEEEEEKKKKINKNIKSKLKENRRAGKMTRRTNKKRSIKKHIKKLIWMKGERRGGCGRGESSRCLSHSWPSSQSIHFSHFQWTLSSCSAAPARQQQSARPLAAGHPLFSTLTIMLIPPTPPIPPYPSISPLTWPPPLSHTFIPLSLPPPTLITPIPHLSPASSLILASHSPPSVFAFPPSPPEQPRLGRHML